MKRMFILFSLCLAVVILSTTYASAGKKISYLSGEFATISTRSCVQPDADGDFGPGPQFRLLALGIPDHAEYGSTRVYQGAGLLSLFGDGHGAWSGKFIMINNNKLNHNDYPVSAFQTDCDVTYNSKPDGTIEFTYKNCGGSFTAGYYGPETLTGSYTDVVDSARLSADGNTLVSSDLDPSVETTWLTTANVTTTYKRICSRTGIAIRLPDKGHK